MTTTKPPKELVRAAMQQHRKDRIIPTPAEIRRMLGWSLIVAARAAERGQDIIDEFR